MSATKRSLALCDCPICQEAAAEATRAEEDRRMTLFAVAWVAERYGLDDTGAVRHLQRHAIDGTGVLQ